MAMTKKEREDYDAAIKNVRIALALHWTLPEKSNIPIPKSGSAYGWLFDLNKRKAYEAWTRNNTYGDMPETRSVQYKGGHALYSTKAKALAAMRHEVEKQAAQALLAIDRMIAAE